MRVLHTSDWHLGKKLEDISRLDEQKEILSEIIDIANNQDVDLVVIAGDIYDTSNPSNDAQELFYKTVKKLSNNGKRIIIAIAGNHDSSDGINAPDPIAKMNGIFMIGDLNKITTPFKLDSGVELINSESGFLEFKFQKYDYPVRVLVTPYTNEVRLRKLLSAKNGEKEVLKLLEKKWQTLSDKYCDKNGVNILTAHLYMAGNGEIEELEPEDERSILHIGGLRKLYTSSVPLSIQYTALGHLHKFNVFMNSNNSPIVYSGSILEYSFSEAMQEKFVMISDILPNSVPQTKKIEIKSGKKLKRAKFKDINKAIAWLEINQDFFIELTIITDSFIDTETQKKLYASHKRIVSIIPELASNNKNKNDQNISLNEDFDSLFINFFKSKNNNLSPTDEILDLLKEIRSME